MGLSEALSLIISCAVFQLSENTILMSIILSIGLYYLINYQLSAQQTFVLNY